MTRWLLAAVPLVVGVGSAYVHFLNNLSEVAFHRVFLVCSVLWFSLSLWAQKTGKPRNSS
ncbi:MAG TPA: hypothetical protein PLF84_09480 [Bryobacteraceae bacterium]|nr:hypothetical protein [Bryobacterales bacterium]HRJ19266.1 hypothetical protein [Bryobacteraceae bacterium]